MKFGLADEDYLLISNALSTLKAKGARIYCFGSRARGDHGLFSDLDLMIEGESDFSSELATLREQFEESRLPIKVDLAQLKDFAESYKPGYQRDKLPF